VGLNYFLFEIIGHLNEHVLVEMLKKSCTLSYSPSFLKIDLVRKQLILRSQV